MRSYTLLLSHLGSLLNTLALNIISIKKTSENTKSLDIRIKALSQILDKNIDDYDNQPIFTRSPNKISKNIDST